ncbi:MAG TPA: DsbA family protein [Candidatus Binataceae bacterium]|jgi:2-hydroxychromene-2-carboxylate isomerase|nr:DsbA family protein [Candidatus Binataceae bacterium]
MADALETIKLYYDFKSPFTYLAMEPAYRLEETHRIRLRFIPLELAVREAYGGELEQRAQRDWDKVRYLYMDVRRFANERGIIIRGPQKIFDSRLALMSGLYADRNGRFRPYADRVFERFFKRELNLENFVALAAVMAEVGLEAEGFRSYAESDGPGDLRAAATEAERDGVFGVPTFNVAGELFWGNDRVGSVIKKLDQMKLRRTRAA